MLAAAFAQAFNALVAQGAALGSARPAVAAAAAPALTTAVDTKLWTAPGGKTALRSLRPATLLTATGKREGLFVEVRDSVGTTGWVAVEDLK